MLRPYSRAPGEPASGIAMEPVANDVVVKLLGPEHPREACRMDVLCVG